MLTPLAGSTNLKWGKERQQHRGMSEYSDQKGEYDAKSVLAEIFCICHIERCEGMHLDLQSGTWRNYTSIQRALKLVLSYTPAGEGNEVFYWQICQSQRHVIRWYKPLYVL